jgi:hypothetical protein
MNFPSSFQPDNPATAEVISASLSRFATTIPPKTDSIYLFYS